MPLCNWMVRVLTNALLPALSLLQIHEIDDSLRQELGFVVAAYSFVFAFQSSV